MSTELLPPPDKNVVVLARNPQEVERAQSTLLQWAERKVEVERAALVEAEENLDHVRRMKIKTAGWESQVRRARKRVDYYDKVRLAIEAGYVIVPNMGMDLVAVRTDRHGPPTKTLRGGEWNVPDINHRQLPAGKGRYVDPRPVTDSYKLTEKNAAGNEYQQTYSQAIDFDEEIDFPMKVVRPQVLTDLDAAMKLGIFDEIGFLPHQGRSGDPMVIGRVCLSRNRQVSFLITWWIDTRAL